MTESTEGQFSSVEFETQLHLFSQRLQEINSQQDVICSLSERIISVKDNPVILQLYIRLIEEYSITAPPEQLIPLLYLLNDFAQKCKNHAHMASEAIINIFNLINIEYTEYMAKARRCFNIWKSRGIFDSNILKQLDYALLGLAPPLLIISSSFPNVNTSESSNISQQSISDIKLDSVNSAEDPIIHIACIKQRDIKLYNLYQDICNECGTTIRDASSAREKRKIIQNLEFSITKTPKGSQKEKLLKLLEMEWNLHCNICDNILKLIEKLDQFHLQVTNKLCEILNIEEKIVESTLKV
ncbi:uncharacterized protein CMU_013620 [Cryptosporidium muris RN66]|uniref:CID domain-containing protein n=1 Tax=Cryptosporidium muris (strain RN66) TaxID=441375 RepID=B6AES0_CRYMR|nr:uncharacterized protein CMU_013620 [Cryptosporidium muris RN66]EEA06687.1 hypothetical protein, conserved [Cryptosporidium muris RN66]|eukprot:XP_002141036.1 hypothetical protein [Cryptosporidium muris RN66]